MKSAKGQKEENIAKNEIEQGDRSARCGCKEPGATQRFIALRRRELLADVSVRGIIWRHTVFLNVGRRGAVEPGPKGVGRRHNHQGLERRWCRTWAAIHCGLEVVLEHALATDCRRGHRRSDLITSCDAYTSGRGVRWPWARLATNFVGRLRRGAAPDEGRRWKGDDRGGCTKECRSSGRPVGADLIAGAPPPAALFRFL